MDEYELAYDYGDDDDYEYDAYEDFERQLQDCGYDPEFEGKCWHIGTEWCSFHCPLHDSVFHNESDDIPF